MDRFVKKIGQEKGEKEIYCDSLKAKLDEAIIEAIIIDGRSHLDFRKKGMLGVFEILAPGYKPQCRQTIRKKLFQK